MTLLDKWMNNGNNMNNVYTNNIYVKTFNMICQQK